MRAVLRPITQADCEALAPLLRPADALEVRRASGLEPLEVLLRSVELSESARVALFDGQLVCAYGLVKPEILGPIAIPWLLTTAAVERHPLAFFKIAKLVCDRWAERNPILVQMVDDEYEGAKLFLQKLGFQIHPPVPHGVSRALFCPAVRSR